MTRPKTIIGYKMLRKDGSSLRDEGRVVYTKKWQDVSVNGAYLAIFAGLTSGGTGAICAEIEAVICSEKEVSAPCGVRCFGRVRVRRFLTCPTATALAAYEKADATAFAAYEKAEATALAAYEKAEAPALKAMMATCKEISVP
jgi:hypothetical protein